MKINYENILDTMNPYESKVLQKHPIFSVYTVNTEFGNAYFIDNHATLEDYKALAKKCVDGRTYLTHFSTYAEAVAYQKQLY